MDSPGISDFVRKLREFEGSKAEQRVLELIDELSAADMRNISDDLMYSIVMWTTSYILHRISGYKEEKLLRDDFIESSAKFLSPYVSRRAAIDLLVKRFHCVRQHPSRPLDLLDEYHSGCESQRAQYLAKHNSTENDSTENDSTENDSTENNSTENDSTENDSTENNSTENNSTENDSTENNSTENNSTENNSTENDSTENNSTENKSTENNSTENDSTENNSTKNDSTKSDYTKNDFTVLADAPAPCLEPPERTGFSDGMIRVAPCYSDDLVRDILTHVSQQNITFLLSHVTVRLQLANPLCLSRNPIDGVSCNSCCRAPIVVAFQAITPNDERNSMSFYEDCLGYDICIPCAVYFVHEAQQRLRAALALPPPLSRPFAVPNVRLTVQSAARTGKAVRLCVALAPQSARLCVWELPATAPVAPVAPLAPLAPVAPLDSLGSELWALPLPPPDWPDVCRVATAAAQRPFGHCDDCAVCLTLLRDSDEYGAVVETACGHKFHAYCIESMRNQPHVAGCPLCRDPSYLKRMAKERVYDVELTLRECIPAAPPAVCVAVAAMLTSVYTNPTNIVACEVIRLYPGSLLSYECQPPNTGVKALSSADSSDI